MGVAQYSLPGHVATCLGCRTFGILAASPISCANIPRLPPLPWYFCRYRLSRPCRRMAVGVKHAQSNCQRLRAVYEGAGHAIYYAINFVAIHLTRLHITRLMSMAMPPSRRSRACCVFPCYRLRTTRTTPVSMLANGPRWFCCSSRLHAWFNLRRRLPRHYHHGLPTIEIE